MAVGKNKGLKGKRGKGKKIIDPFTKKEWYDIRAPSQFAVRNCGKTPVVSAAIERETECLLACFAGCGLGGEGVRRRACGRAGRWSVLYMYVRASLTGLPHGRSPALARADEVGGHPPLVRLA